MKAHLEAIRTAINAACPVDLWAPDPERIPPWMSIEAPSWAPDPDECMCGTPHQMEAAIRVRAIAGTPDGVEVLLRNARVALGNGRRRDLTVSGRDASIRWERGEFIGLDPDATIPGTNRHPAVGVDTYTLTSRPKEAP